MTTPILDEWLQVINEANAARILYRQAQADKALGGSTQQDVNELLDDYEHLVRYGNYLQIKANAELKQASLPEVDENESIEAIRARLYARLEEAA